MGPVGVYKGGGLVRGLYSSPQAAVQCRGNMNWSRLVRAKYHICGSNFLEISHKFVTNSLLPDTDMPG